MLRAIINDEGIVIDVKEMQPNGLTRDVEYDPKETKSIIGSRIYTPNGCCWIKKPGDGWICVPC
jgi:hypothetical protein